MADINTNKMVDITSPTGDIVKQKAADNSRLLNTIEQAGTANASVMSGLSDIQKTGAASIQGAYTNLQQISRVSSLDPEIAGIMGLFSSKWDAGRQQLEIAKSQAAITDASNRATSLIELNKSNIELAKTRSAITDSTLADKFKIEDQAMQRQANAIASQTAYLALKEDKRKEIDHAIDAIPQGQLSSTIEQARAGKGQFKDYVGILEKHEQDIASGQSILSKNLTEADRASEDRQTELLSNASMNVLKTLNDKMTTDGLAETKINGMTIRASQVSKAMSMRATNDKAAMDAYHTATATQLNIQPRVDAATSAGYGLSAIDPSLVPNDELSAVIEAGKGDQSQPSHVAMIDDRVKLLETKVQEGIKTAKEPFATKEAQDAVEGIIKNGGVPISSVQATAPGVEMALSPAGGTGSYFHEAGDLIRDGVSGVVSKQYGLGSSSIFSKGTVDTNAIMDAFKTGKVKPQDVGAAFLANQTLSQPVRNNMLDKSAAVLLQDAIINLAKPTVDATGQHGPSTDPIWVGIKTNLNGFRSDPSDPFSPIDSAKLVSYLYQKKLESRSTIDYVGQFVGSLKTMSDGFGKRFMNSGQLDLRDRTNIGMLFNNLQGYNNSVAVATIGLISNQVKTQGKNFAESSTRDLDTNTGASAMVPLGGGGVYDPGDLPSNTGANITVRQSQDILSSPTPSPEKDATYDKIIARMMEQNGQLR